MKKILIHRARIVNEGKKFIGSVLIEGEDIAKVYTAPDKIDIPAGCEVIEAEGKLLLPGVIDDQVHFRDPGLTHKGDLATETRAAVAGGITSIMEMPNTIPQTITNGLLREKHKIAAEKSVTNYSFYLGATNDNIDEIKKIDPAVVCGVKVFMGASTGNMLVDKEESLRNIFSEAPGIVACHCEDETTIRNNTKAYIEEYGEDMPFSYHPLIRSRDACLKSSALAVRLAREYGTRLHILHLSTAGEMELFDNSIPLEEKKITAEVCVHHLWFDDTWYQEKGALIKWNPAIKTPFDRKALLDAVKNDKIDIIATDHAPHTLEEKSQVYTKSPSGGPLVQHSLVAMLDLWHLGEIELEKIVEKMCHNPATLFGVEKRGFIRPGYRADLVLVDPDRRWEVTPENILYKCGWSPFMGHRFRSSVISTFVNGNRVWNEGVIEDSFRGQPLSFATRKNP
ncbi:MAG: dihydroorotase [Bacteroidales bacterium]